MTKATIQLQKKKQTGPTKDGKTSDPTNEDHKVSSRCGECKKPLCSNYSQKQVVCHNCVYVLYVRGSKPKKMKEQLSV